MTESEIEEIMAQFKLGSVTTINRDAFENMVTAARHIPWDWDFSKRFSVVLEYDPDEVVLEITYSVCE